MSDDTRSGGPESSITPDKLRGRVAEELREALARGETPRLREVAGRHGLAVAEVGHILEGVRAMTVAFGGGDPAARAAAPSLPDDYEVLGELGRGAMGVVYRARQRSLGRVVAVKVLRPGDVLFADLADRFHREVRALAKLRHPHIVAVHEVGEAGGQLFFSMDLVEGRSLHQLVAAGEITPTRAVKLLTQVASAIAYTHSHGLVHRDLKPGNILVDAKDDAYVVDFGLARDSAIEAQLTGTGQIVGTPAYMSPEQARGDTAHIGEATDVYALGAVLYECLTRHAPFEGRPLAETIRAVVQDEPVAPRKIDERIPRDLEVICLTAMAKEPQRRYPSAQAFQEDLERFVEGLPIRARPVSLAGRLRRWTTRNPALAASVAGIFVALVVGLAVALTLLAEATRARNAKTEALKERDTALGDLQREMKAKAAALRVAEVKSRQYRSSALVQASEGAEASDPMLALLLSREAARIDPSPEARRRLRAALRASRERVVLKPEGSVTVSSAAMFPDGKRVLLSCNDGTARVWDAGGREIACLRRPESSASSTLAAAAVSPAADLIVTGYVNDATARVWDASGRQVATLASAVEPAPSGAQGCVVSAEFSSDGKRILTCGDDGTARVWSAQGEPLGVIRAGGREHVNAVLHPDGERVLTTDPLPVRLWDVHGTLLATFDGAGHGSGTVQAELSPDGDLVLAGYDDPRPGDERLVASLSGESIPSAKLWDLTGREVARFRVMGGVSCLAMSRPFGSRVYLEGKERRKSPVRYVVIGDSYRTHVFEARGEELGTLDAAGRDVREIRFVGDNEAIARLEDGSARMWTIANRFDISSPPPHFVVGGTETACFRAPGRLSEARLSPARDRVVAVGGGACRLFDLRDSEFALISAEHLRGVSFSHAGDRFVTTGADGNATVFDADGNRKCVLPGEHALVAASFAPADDAILTASEDGTARLWTRDGAETAALRGHGKQLTSACFSPDGTRVLTSSVDGTARLWDRAGKAVAVLAGHEGSVQSAVYSAAGDRIVTASNDGTARVWSSDGKALSVLRAGRPVWFAAPIADSGACALVVSKSEFPVMDEPGVTMSSFWMTLSDAGGLEVWGADGTRSAALPATTRAGTDGVSSTVDLDEIETRRKGNLPGWSASDEQALESLRQEDASRVGLQFVRADGTWRLAGAPESDAVRIARRDRAELNAGDTSFTAISPAGRRVLTYDGKELRLWLVSTEELLGLAAKRCTRDFTAEERKRFAALLE